MIQPRSRFRTFPRSHGRIHVANTAAGTQESNIGGAATTCEGQKGNSGFPVPWLWSVGTHRSATALG
jgi:hypothetical protein